MCCGIVGPSATNYMLLRETALSKALIYPREDLHEVDLGQDASINGVCERRREEKLMLPDLDGLSDHRRSPVGDAEVVITHVEHVPQPRTLEVLSISFQGSCKRLVNIELCSDAYCVTRQLPRDVTQPESSDAQSPHVIDGVVAGEHGRGDESEELSVALVKGLCRGRDVKRRDGEDGRGEKLRGLAHGVEGRMCLLKPNPEVMVKGHVKPGQVSVINKSSRTQLFQQSLEG